jgi:hypothetical protein
VVRALAAFVVVVQVAAHEPAIPGSVDSEVPEAQLLQANIAEGEYAGGKPCVQRKDETQQLLEAYQAARLVHLDSPEYGVEDETTSQLVHAWETQYKEAQAEYDFYCTQTTADLDEIAAAVHKKEVVAVQNAAQAGLIAAQATIKHKRLMAAKAHEKAEKLKEQEERALKLRKKSAREKTDKIADEAITKNTERLRRLPQITRSLYGKVRDGATGKAVQDAAIKSTCLFTVHDGHSRENGKFTIGNGVSGPSGRQCNVEISKPGYTTATFPITVMKGDTDALYRESMLLPEITSDQTFRFVLQYGASPPNLDAHVLVPMPDATYLDIGENPLLPDSTSLKYGSSGSKEALPFATMDHTAHRFGPETASVHNVNDGVYHFMVANAAQSFTTADEFHSSTARAFLYQGNKLLSTVAIDTATGPASQLWSVYTLSCLRGVCSLKIANKFLGESPIH